MTVMIKNLLVILILLILSGCSTLNSNISQRKLDLSDYKVCIVFAEKDPLNLHSTIVKAIDNSGLSVYRGSDYSTIDMIIRYEYSCHFVELGGASLLDVFEITFYDYETEEILFKTDYKGSVFALFNTETSLQKITGKIIAKNFSYF